MTNDPSDRALAKLRILSAYVIISAWLFVVVLSTVSPQYQSPNLILSGPVALVLAYLFRVTKPTPNEEPSSSESGEQP